jgi:hypothetical protein
MIKTELLLTVLLSVIVAGSLSVASFESNAQDFTRNGIDVSVNVIKFSSSTVVTSSSTTTTYPLFCSEFECMKLLMMPTSVEVAMGGIATVHQSSEDTSVVLQKNTSNPDKSELTVNYGSNESKHYSIELFE